MHFLKGNHLITSITSKIHMCTSILLNWALYKFRKNAF